MNVILAFFRALLGLGKPARRPLPAPRPPAAGSLGAPRALQVAAGPFAPRMMSDRANAWLQGADALLFAGSRATGGPQFFRVRLANGDTVDDLGDAGIPYRGETEGWLWLPDGSLIVLDGPRLRRLRPFTGGTDDIVLDISDMLPGHDLWQPHASDDGQTFSATVRKVVADGRYPYVGTIIKSSRQGYRFIEARGVLDESQVDRSGRFVVIKEDDDNRIVTIDSGDERVIRDSDGALGHSDCGDGFIVGEANLPDPGRCVRVDLQSLQRRDLFFTSNMGYVSVRNGRCLHSSPTHLSLVALDGSGETPILEHGAGNDYDDRPKANLDPSGRVACYMVGGALHLAIL